MLDSAHEGYEYQDYLSVAFALREVLMKRETRIIIDRKSSENDKFDDLKLYYGDSVECYQIKYSDLSHNHKLTKYDLSNGNGYGIDLAGLYRSWNELKKERRNVRLILCTAWANPIKGDKIWEVVKRCPDAGFVVPSDQYELNVNILWPENEGPLHEWKKFRKEMFGVARGDFAEFCKCFSIRTELPKASLDLKNPGRLEDVLLYLAKRLGAGVYPNESISPESIIYNLAATVKRARAVGETVSVPGLPQKLGLIVDYGVISQSFHVNDSLYVRDEEQFVKVKRELDRVGRVVLLGNPGSGKSWFVEKFAAFLKGEGKHVLRFHCYISLDDSLAKERIKTKLLYANFVGQLVSEYPSIEKEKNTLLGADREEFENLLKYVPDDCYIIIDGLDHIQRQYELYETSVTLSETKIVEELSNISFPQKVHVMLSSQPLDQFRAFFDKGYIRLDIEQWLDQKILLLMKKYGVNDMDFGDGRSLHSFLQDKSQGNVLYLNYLLKQLQNQDISERLLYSIPDYDPSLKMYYEYLYRQIGNKKIVYSLCGADFYLSSSELKDITGYGIDVEDELKILIPILNENSVSGGFLLYHESFRRYMIEYLKSRGMKVYKVIYDDLIDWLAMKDFYGFRKSYCHLLKLLFQVERFGDAVEYLQPDFILNSIRFGYSYQLTKQNIKILTMCAGCLKSFPLIAMASELDNMLEIVLPDASVDQDYFQALCDLNGAKQSNAMLEYDGKATFSQETGIMLCYMCSKAGIMPWWKLYIDKGKKEWRADEFPYYIRAMADSHGVNSLPSILIDMEKWEPDIRAEFQEAIYEDVKGYLGIEGLCSVAEENHLVSWKQIMNGRENNFYVDEMISDTEIEEQIEKIMGFASVTEEDAMVLDSFFSQIRKRLEKGDEFFGEEMIGKCSGNNWFYNWVIYTLMVIKIQVEYQKAEKTQEDDKKAPEQSIFEALEMLLKDTEVFRGSPRICDIYGARNLILKTFRMALSFVKHDNHMLGRMLEILEKVSENTTYSVDNTNGGPLPDYAWVKILTPIMHESNKDIILPFIFRAKRVSQDTEGFGMIASVNFQIASLLKDIDRDEAEKYYREGVR